MQATRYNIYLLLVNVKSSRSTLVSCHSSIFSRLDPSSCDMHGGRASNNIHPTVHISLVLRAVTRRRRDTYDGVAYLLTRARWQSERYGCPKGTRVSPLGAHRFRVIQILACRSVHREFSVPSFPSPYDNLNTILPRSSNDSARIPSWRASLVALLIAQLVTEFNYYGKGEPRERYIALIRPRLLTFNP